MSKRKAVTQEGSETPAPSPPQPVILSPAEVFEFGEPFDGATLGDDLIWEDCELRVDIGPLKAGTEIDELRLDQYTGVWTGTIYDEQLDSRGYNKAKQIITVTMSVVSMRVEDAPKA